jgi:hypothetical protein
MYVISLYTYDIIIGISYHYYRYIKLLPSWYWFASHYHYHYIRLLLSWPRGQEGRWAKILLERYTFICMRKHLYICIYIYIYTYIYINMHGCVYTCKYMRMHDIYLFIYYRQTKKYLNIHYPFLSRPLLRLSRSIKLTMLPCRPDKMTS